MLEEPEPLLCPPLAFELLFDELLLPCAPEPGEPPPPVVALLPDAGPALPVPDAPELGLPAAVPQVVDPMGPELFPLEFAPEPPTPVPKAPDLLPPLARPPAPEFPVADPELAASPPAAAVP